jgi:hypothetical protein
MVKGFAIFSTLAVAIVTAAACGVHQSDSAPPLTGPSQYGQAITVAANPDRISIDGTSTSAITVEVRHCIAPPSSQCGEPMPNVQLRVDMVVFGAFPCTGGCLKDYGTLSARNIVTGADGRAFVTYTSAPKLSDLAEQNIFTVSIRVIAVDSDAATAVVHTVDIRLVPPGVIIGPADTPTASFQFSPAAVAPNQPVFFDATASCGGTLSGGVCPVDARPITSYSWNFGDGASGSGATVTHNYPSVASFVVTLTVTNDRGKSASTTKTVIVTASPPPFASFTFSPTVIHVNDTVFFNGSPSIASPGRTISFDWDFGDGSAHGSGVTPTHKYLTANIFRVTLTVTDDLGQQNVTSNGVTIVP